MWHKYCIDVADWLIESLMRILFLKSSPLSAVTRVGNGAALIDEKIRV